MNETENAFVNNYEIVDVFTSWNDNDRVIIKEKAFDKLWNKEDNVRGLCVGVSNFRSNNDYQLWCFLAAERYQVIQSTHRKGQKPRLFAFDYFRLHSGHYIKIYQPRFYGRRFTKVVCFVFLLFKFIYGKP